MRIVRKASTNCGIAIFSVEKMGGAMDKPSLTPVCCFQKCQGIHVGSKTVAVWLKVGCEPGRTNRPFADHFATSMAELQERRFLLGCGMGRFQFSGGFYRFAKAFSYQL